MVQAYAQQCYMVVRRALNAEDMQKLERNEAGMLHWLCNKVLLY